MQLGVQLHLSQLMTVINIGYKYTLRWLYHYDCQGRFPGVSSYV